MGWTSIDDFVAETTANGKYCRTDWQKLYAQAAATAGRWYDLSLGQGNPSNFSYYAGLTPYVGGYGEMLRNGGFQGGANYWTLSDAGWVWASNTMTKVNAGAAGALISTGMQKTPVAGRTYRITWTMSACAGGNIVARIGNTAGAARAAAGTYTETLIAANGDALRFTPSAIGTTATITYISVIEPLQSFTMDDSLQGSMYHGGDVAPDSKHLINAGCVTPSATTAPTTLTLVDMLMCYPGIALNSAAVQTFLNANVLPRYADGVGVRSYLVTNVLAGAATPSLYMRYENTAALSDRTLPNVPVLVTGTPSQHIPHTGVAAGNFGPFLPWQAGDLGMVNAQSLQISSTMTTGEACLMLCKPLAALPVTTQYVMAERDYFNQLPSLPRIYDGACLGLIACAGAAIPATGSFQGYCDFAWG